MPKLNQKIRRQLPDGSWTTDAIKFCDEWEKIIEQVQVLFGPDARVSGFGNGMSIHFVDGDKITNEQSVDLSESGWRRLLQFAQAKEDDK